MEEFRTIDCESPLNPNYKAHKYRWNDLIEKLNRDSAISAAINFLHLLAYTYTKNVFCDIVYEKGQLAKRCRIGTVPVDTSVISYKEWTEDDPFPEKMVSGDAGCRLGSALSGTYLSMQKWGFRYEPWHRKPDYLCHGFVCIRYTQSDTLYIRKCVDRTWNEEGDTSPKNDCSKLITQRVTVSRQRDYFIETVREVYKAAKYIRVLHCWSPEMGTGRWTPTTIFDCDEVSDIVELGKVPNAAINFLQNVGYTHSFGLESNY